MTQAANLKYAGGGGSKVVVQNVVQNNIGATGSPREPAYAYQPPPAAYQPAPPAFQTAYHPPPAAAAAPADWQQSRGKGGKFCSSCGATKDGRFCGACGAE